MNEEKLIGACLRSLASQATDYPYEIIIVDTHSSDQTLPIARQFGARIIKENRPGKSIARQTAANAANGKYLCFTEADCEVPENWINTIVTAFDQFSQVAAVTGIYTFSESNSTYRIISKILLLITVYLFYFIHGHHSLRATNFAITKRSLAKAGGFNTTAKEFDDVELSMRAKKTGKILFMPALECKSSDRRTRGRKLLFLRDFLKTYINTCLLKKIVSEQIYEDIR